MAGPRSWENCCWRNSSSFSNRVAIPEKNAKLHPGGLEVAVDAAFKHRSGIWFGWSGKITAHTRITTQKAHDNITYITLDLSKEDHQEYYNGFANRVLWPILHYRVDLAEFSRRDLSGYLRVNEPRRQGIYRRAKYRGSRRPHSLALCGAAHECKEALLVNPYDPDSVAVAIGQALSMPLAERRERHKAIFEMLSHNDIQTWAARFLRALQPEPATSSRHDQV